MSHDPIRLELIKNALESVVDEMVITIVRIAYSSIIKDTMDVSSAFCDAKGRMIAQGLSIPLHLGSFPDAMQAVLSVFGDNMFPGDVAMLNDPYQGGMHLPDVFLIKPVFVGDHKLGYAIIVAHHNDVGGRVAGSSAADSTEIYQEGIRIPVVKLFDRGVPNDAVFKIFARNSRIPDTVTGDLHAQIAACRSAEAGMLKLVDYFGLEVLEEYFEHLLDYSEGEARRTIAAIPDGVYRGIDYLDDDGITPDRAVPVAVTVTVAGDEIEVDFEGTSPQVAGAINATLSFAKSSVYFAIRSVMESNVPNNAGFFRPIRIKAPLGTLVNPKSPGAVAARGVTGYRIIDAVYLALAQAIPDRVRAAGEGGITSYSIASTDASGRFSLFRETIMGAWGGGFERDGIDGVANPCVNVSNAPVELVENQNPLLIERYEFVEDSGGGGRWRGGLSIERRIRFLTDVKVSIRSDRRTHRPYGLAGGGPGNGSASHFQSGAADWELLPTKFNRSFSKGDRLRHRTAGAGGYGDALERDAGDVTADVRGGKISPAAARRIYGVAIDAEGHLQAGATSALRDEMRGKVS